MQFKTYPLPPRRGASAAATSSRPPPQGYDDWYDDDDEEEEEEYEYEEEEEKGKKGKKKRKKNCLSRISRSVLLTLSFILAMMLCLCLACLVCYELRFGYFGEGKNSGNKKVDNKEAKSTAKDGKSTSKNGKSTSKDGKSTEPETADVDKDNDNSNAVKADREIAGLWYKQPPPPTNLTVSWTAWTACSATCGRGAQTRFRLRLETKLAEAHSRICVVQRCCESRSNDVKSTTVKPTISVTKAPPSPYIWTRWLTWPICSKPCDGGFKKSFRRCQTRELDLTMERNCGDWYKRKIPCNIHPCIVGAAPKLSVLPTVANYSFSDFDAAIEPPMDFAVSDRPDLNCTQITWRPPFNGSQMLSAYYVAWLVDGSDEFGDLLPAANDYRPWYEYKIKRFPTGAKVHFAVETFGIPYRVSKRIKRILLAK